MVQLELLFGADVADNECCTSVKTAEPALPTGQPVGADDPPSVDHGRPGSIAGLGVDAAAPSDESKMLSIGVTDITAQVARGPEGDHFDLSVPDQGKRPDTLDDALVTLRVAGQLDSKLMKRLTSDVRMATKLALRTATTKSASVVSLPCAPTELRGYLAQVLPARHRMTAKRWGSIKSSVTMVLKLTGWHASKDELRAPLTPEWQAAADMIATAPQRALVASLGRFCARHGIGPADMTEETLEQYRAWRSENTLDLDVRHNISSLRCIWNRAAKGSPSWPGRHLAPPPDPRRYVLPLDQLDPRFLADLDAYLTRLRNPSPPDPKFNRRKAPLTISDIRGTLLRAASVLVSKGFSVTCIRDVVAPDRYKSVLLDAYERLSDGRTWPTRAVSIANYLHAAARDWTELSPEELAEVTALRKMVKAPAREMTQQSRDRVAQFDDLQLLAAFFELPYETFLAADRMFEEGRPKRAAQLHQVALALAILQAKPLRRENLAELEHGRHFSARGRFRFAGLSIPGNETKSGAHLQATLPDRLARRIEKHVATYRPLIESAPCPFLFPGPKGHHIADRTLAKNVTALVERQIGARFNVHLIRHLAATLLLDDDPGNLPVAQSVLGHSDEKTTARYYAQQRTRSAQGAWMQMLEKRVASARRKTGKPSSGRTNRAGKASADSAT